jgi:3-methyladenine DNA glycosylase AlkD
MAKSPLTAAQFIKQLKTLQSPIELKKYHRYFTFDEQEKGDGDRFIGVRMGQVFALAKEFIEMPLAEIEKLLESPIHEVRAGGCSIMDKQARSKKTSLEQRKALYDLYLRRHDRINNWDLVDLCAIHVVGGYLADKPRGILLKLARSKSTWERRTAILSTAYFIRQGELDDTYRIAGLLLKDKQDLVHKATGWMLRFAGDKDRQRLLAFLDQHAGTMPRVALRYTIEKLDKKTRDHYLGMKKSQ